MLQGGVVAFDLSRVFDSQGRVNKEIQMTIKRISDVLKTFGFRSRTTIYKNIQLGLFTRPIVIGQRSVGWLDAEVNAICAARVAGMSEDQLRALVVQLHERRLKAIETLVLS